MSTGEGLPVTPGDDFFSGFERIGVFDRDAASRIHAGSSPRVVIGDDDRELVPSLQLIPFCYVGQVIAHSRRVPNTRRFGTVFLIGADRVATAAHNLFVKDQPADRWDIYFGSHGDRDAADVVYCRGTAARRHPSYVPGDLRSPFDVATLRLEFPDRPLPETFGVLRVVNTRPGQLAGNEGAVCGYPSDVPRPYRDTRFDDASQYYHLSRITAHVGGRVYYSTDTTRGQSGSPLIVRVRGERGEVMSAAAGIHVTGRATPTSNASVAMESTIVDFLFPDLLT